MCNSVPLVAVNMSRLGFGISVINWVSFILKKYGNEKWDSIENIKGLFYDVYEYHLSMLCFDIFGFVNIMLVMPIVYVLFVKNKMID